MNSTFLLGGHLFSCYDALDYLPPSNSNMSIWLEVDGQNSFDKIYSAIIENGGHIITPAEDTFWNSQYAKVLDKFGVTWELNMQK